MNLIASYMIPLDPRTKKNHQTIAGRGTRCFVCGKPAQQFIRQGKANTEYAAKAARFLTEKPKKPITGTVAIVYRLYMQTRRRVDDLNLYAALDDILVKEKILPDDNITIIRSRDGSRVFYDKENPRAEIYIYEYDEKEDEHGIRERNENVYGG